jgi:hypothetical protein
MPSFFLSSLQTRWPTKKTEMVWVCSWRLKLTFSTSATWYWEKEKKEKKKLLFYFFSFRKTICSVPGRFYSCTSALLLPVLHKTKYFTSPSRRYSLVGIIMLNNSSLFRCFDEMNDYFQEREREGPIRTNQWMWKKIPIFEIGKELKKCHPVFFRTSSFILENQNN